MNTELNEKYYSEYLNGLLEGKWERCSEIINHYLTINDNPSELYENIIKKSLYEIGNLWERNKISVAAEHLASSITESLINKVFYTIDTKSKINKKIVLSCVENEQHQIGIKMVADVFERNGWNTYLLGANTPARDIVNITKIVNADFIALSLTIYYNLPVLDYMLSVIRKQFNEIPVLVGGQAFTRGGYDIFTKYNNVVYISDLFELENYLQKLN